MDDTDVATVDNVRPIYRLLEELGFRTTKTVWPVACPEGSENFHTSEPLEDAAYREFVCDLARRGVLQRLGRVEVFAALRTRDGPHRLGGAKPELFEQAIDRANVVNRGDIRVVHDREGESSPARK